MKPPQDTSDRKCAPSTILEASTRNPKTNPATNSTFFLFLSAGTTAASPGRIAMLRIAFAVWPLGKDLK